MAAKLVVCVRNDLGMGKGKIAAQVGHASVDAALAAKRAGGAFSGWKKVGQPKVVVRVDGLDELEAIERDARAANLPTTKITDAGHTQLEPGTTTCLAVGPAKGDRIDAVTGHLSLL